MRIKAGQGGLSHSVLNRLPVEITFDLDTESEELVLRIPMKVKHITVDGE